MHDIKHVNIFCRTAWQRDSIQEQYTATLATILSLCQRLRLRWRAARITDTAADAAFAAAAAASEASAAAVAAVAA